MEFYTTAPGQVRAEIFVPIKYEGYPGIVHGGIIAAILDETGGRAYMDGSHPFMVTGQLKVRYRKPVPIKTALVALGKAVQRKRHVSKAHSEIQTLDGEVLAEADLVLVDIPDEKYANVDPQDLGWRVYPDKEET
ncbi:MAG: PaaI family thioesterase [Chloroflexota bacterium]|nr:PaaI family thioesterase [Chloroflexota bacterium]